MLELSFLEDDYSSILNRSNITSLFCNLTSTLQTKVHTLEICYKRIVVDKYRLLIQQTFTLKLCTLNRLYPE